jgi:hypothetical protein
MRTVPKLQYLNRKLKKQIQVTEVLFMWWLTNYSHTMKNMDMSLLGFYQREEKIQREYIEFDMFERRGASKQRGPSVSTGLFCLLISPLQDPKRGFQRPDRKEEQPGPDKLKLGVDKDIPFS